MDRKEQQKKRAYNLGLERNNSRNITIGGTALDVAQPMLRKSLYLRNISTAGQIIYVSLSNEAVASTTDGYPLNVNDAILDSNDGEYYFCWSGKITAIASAAGGTLAIVETPEEIL